MLVSDSAILLRGDAIARLGLLQRAGDPALTGLTRVVSYVTGASAAAIHVIDETHQNRVAGVNAPLGAHPREDSMCRLVVDSEHRIVCADATADPRFSYSSFVDGEEPVRFYASVPLRTSEGVVVGTLCSFDTVQHQLTDTQIGLMEDLAAQVVAQIELTRIARDLGHAASYDALTGAANRLVLGDRLAQAFARRMRHGGETFVALCDINHFKLINDNHSHAAGDEVLIEVARRLQNAMRAEDTVARVGGDEFVVMAELDPGSGAEQALERRLKDVLAAPIHFDGADRSVTVSVGCVLAEPGEDIRALLARADAAMYRRKAECRVPAPAA